MSLTVHENERGGRGAAPKSIDQIKREVMDFLRDEAGFAQVVTINSTEYPVARTMGAPVNDDWSVDLIQRNVHKRIGQLRRNPRAEIIWTGAPSKHSVNDRPHVYDFGLDVPRVVFLRGTAEFMDDSWTIERFQRQTGINRPGGYTKAPERTPENVTSELIGIRIKPIQIRAEGFGAGAESFTWSID